MSRPRHRGATASSETGELRSYVRVAASDLERVQHAYPIVAPHLPHVVAIFYERIREHEGAATIFTGEEQVERLQRSLVRWLEGVFRGPHDEAHFAGTERTGLVHVQVGLPCRYIVTAMSVIRTELLAVLAEHDDATKDALARLLDLELAIMVDSYSRHFADRLRRSAAAPPQAAWDEAARAIDRLGVVVIGLDARGHVRLFNDEAETTLGTPKDLALGAHVFDVMRMDDGARAFLEQALRSPPDDPFDLPVLTQSGRQIDLHARVKLAEGALVSTVLTALDVTEEKRAEERSRHTEKLASIGRLAAGLAHEIRNPLHGAHLHLTLLERTLRKQGAEQHQDALESVKTVSDEVQRLAQLVTEFLQFARPQPIERKPVSMSELCRHVGRLLGPEADKRRVEVRLDLPLTDAWVRGDRGKLAQVLVNLVQNAIEAIETQPEDPSREHRGKVVVRVRRHPRTVVVEVIDDGPGVPEVDGSIFDAFCSTKPSGTGLGLSIAHRILDDHDGEIRFESKRASANTRGGTTFRVELPVSDVIPADGGEHG